MAVRELKKYNNTSFFDSLENGDPTTLAVFYEDGVAVIGIVIAFSSLILTKFTEKTYWDSAGSIIIGILLGVVAIMLINKNRSYLIGKNIPQKMKEKIIDIMESDPTIEKVLDFKSSILGIGQYQIKCEIEFNGNFLIKELSRNQSLKLEYESIKNDYDEFLKFCVDYVDRVPRLVGNKIDNIEDKIKKEFPELRHIDIEIN
jgi:zinc transporter 9